MTWDHFPNGTLLSGACTGLSGACPVLGPQKSVAGIDSRSGHIVSSLTLFLPFRVEQ